MRPAEEHDAAEPYRGADASRKAGDHRMKPHPIVWTDEKVARLWDYYTRTGTPYFSQMHGREILKATGLPLNKGPTYVCDPVLSRR